jgi:hypothetical protein
MNDISAGSDDSRHIDRHDDLHVLLTEPLSNRRQGNVVHSAKLPLAGEPCSRSTVAVTVNQIITM